MRKEILLILSIAIGGFMVSVTFDSLGELGNKIMLIIGRLLLIGAIITLSFRIFKKKKSD